jgi:PAS domain S-box-containing protein
MLPCKVLPDIVVAIPTFDLHSNAMRKENYPMLHLFEKTLDLVCIVNKEGWFIRVNPAVTNTLGYSEHELFSQPVSALIHPDDRTLTAERRSDLLEGKALQNFQNRYVTKSGNIVWLQWTSIYIPEKEVVFAIAKDVTSQKQLETEMAENYRKYKELAGHFKHHVEKDRKSFATELHEELAQLATVVRIHFESIARAYNGEYADIKKSVEQGTEATELLIDKIRRLSYSLNPARIEEFGLDAVLRSLCKEFAALTNIPCDYESSFNESGLSNEVRLDLLRICQEALLNVMHHAGATEVKIEVVEKDSKIELSITDNGIGFEHPVEQSFGLKTMQGRAASINGDLLIESEKSKGTKITVSVEK